MRFLKSAIAAKTSEAINSRPSKAWKEKVTVETATVDKENTNAIPTCTTMRRYGRGGAGAVVGG